MTDLAAEREIDLGRWKESAAERWWIVAAGLVVGAVIGGLLALSGGSVWQASVLISPGQAFSPSGAPVLNYLSSPLGIQDLVTSQNALQAGAKAAHIGVDSLRGNVSTESVLTGVTNTAARGAALIKITVQLHQPKKAEQAADALGAYVMRTTTSKYVRTSVGVVQNSIKNDELQLNSLARQVVELNKAIAKTTDPLTRIVLVSEANNAATRQASISNNLALAKQQLSLAQSVEFAQQIGRS